MVPDLSFLLKKSKGFKLYTHQLLWNKDEKKSWENLRIVAHKSHDVNIPSSNKILYTVGVWIDSNYEVMYALASKITFICQMDFNAFPVDIQVWA